MSGAWCERFPNGDNCRQGSWRPADFPAYLRRQEKWQLLNHRLEHNEIIVDKWQWNNALPRIIDAFFVTKGQQPAHMAELHKQFLAEYGRRRRSVQWSHWIRTTGRTRSALSFRS